MSLNKETHNDAYNLGRLFFVCETIQYYDFQRSGKQKDKTFKKSYFSSAAQKPAFAYPPMLKKCQNTYLPRMSVGMRTKLEKYLQSVMDSLGETIPRTLNYPEQSAFHLGYSHEKAQYFIDIEQAQKAREAAKNASKESGEETKEDDYKDLSLGIDEDSTLDVIDFIAD